jgi:hypothetical protein
MDEAMTNNKAPNGSAKRGRNSAKYIYRNIYSRSGVKVNFYSRLEVPTGSKPLLPVEGSSRE